MARTRRKGYVPKPFRAKNPETGAEHGSYKAWNPFTKKIETLGTEDYNEALNKISSIVVRGDAAASEVATPVIGDIAPETVTLQSKPVTGVEGIEAGLVEKWIETQPEPVTAEPITVESPNATSASNGTNGTKTSPPSPPTAPSVVSIPIVTPKRTSPQKGLSSEQAEKLGRGMRKMVTKLNLVGLETGVRWLGRDPFPIDDEELELLALGWELLLEDWFKNNKPEPWMLIVAGNALCAFTMWARGKPIPKKTDDVIITVDESQVKPRRVGA
jgi:hypothetical protein